MWQDRTHGEDKGKSRVRSVTEESPEEQDDHFMVYSTHTVDVKSSCIRVSVCIEGTTLDMQLDTAACVVAARELVQETSQPVAPATGGCCPEDE